MNFSEVIKKESAITSTENGQKALNTTNSKCLDFFASCGALREADDTRITRLFEDSFEEDPLLTMKILFYCRDIRGGLGERETFRKLLTYVGKNYPEIIVKNFSLISEFGRWDDFYSFIGTPVEEEMFSFLKAQLEKDVKNMNSGNSVSLLAKWLKTADASSKETRKLGIHTALKFGYSVYDYKRIVRSLRKYIDVTEVKMSKNDWENINYEYVSSNAMLKYANAFRQRDFDRFAEYLNDVSSGKKKVNASTLFPYDLVRKFYSNWDSFYGSDHLTEEEKDLINSQWNNLPNYVDVDTNVMVMADTSGSMTCNNGLPLNVAVSLAIYFAQRNSGPYHNLWMTFSQSPKFHEIKGKRLEQILTSLDISGWGMNTDLNSAMEHILDLAVKNHIPSNEMPKSLIVISDMEIDFCSDEIFYNHLVEMYEKEGYVLPNIIFWNVNSRHDIFHADSNRMGVQLVSGSSPTIFQSVMAMIGKTPYECMKYVLDNERYSKVVV